MPNDGDLMDLSRYAPDEHTRRLLLVETLRAVPLPLVIVSGHPAPLSRVLPLTPQLWVHVALAWSGRADRTLRSHLGERLQPLGDAFIRRCACSSRRSSSPQVVLGMTNMGDMARVGRVH
jgi:hypothetical protein